MITVKDLIKSLKKYPEESFCFTSEGDIIVISKDGKRELGVIETTTI